jgi:hypothetical protein
MAKKPAAKTKLSVKKSAVKDLSVTGGSKVKGGVVVYKPNSGNPNCGPQQTGPISGTC